MYVLASFVDSRVCVPADIGVCVYKMFVLVFVRNFDCGYVCIGFCTNGGSRCGLEFQNVVFACILHVTLLFAEL